MRIKMLETRRGSEDGFAVKRFEKGQEYEVADTLARSFVNQGWASEAEPEEPKPICNNPAYHDVFATQREKDEFAKIFRPQPTRGSASQNPATLEAIGKLGDGA